MATRDGLAQIWYADANGVVTGYTPNADNVASAIIDTFNEHYGTDIQIWTPETEALQVGGTVPDWNAYEKIGIKLVNGFYKYDITNGQNASFVAMQCEDGLINLYAADVQGEEKVIVYDNEGRERTTSSSSSLIEMVQSRAKLYSNYQGIVLMIKDHNPIANWSEYKPL